MLSAHQFLQALATVLCVAAVTTVLFQWLRQSVVLGYLIAGLIIGPHVPIPLVADTAIVYTLSELGVILLMFSLGLEFRLQKLIRVGPTAGLTAVIECSFMLWLGFVSARLLGWSVRESVFTGAIVAIASTTIIAKTFDEQGIKGKLRETVVGILIVEDLIAILLLATLTAVSSGAGLSARALALTTGRLSGFLIGLVVLGLLLVPRLVRTILRVGRPETTLVATIGICFAIALLAQELGYSVALGAFIAGALVAESGEGERIAYLVQPVRDMFVAIFFVSVGMLIDPALVWRHWPAVVVLTAVVLVGKVVSVTVGAFLTGNGTRVSVEAGLSLAQIGEFSFIIAGLGVALGATRGFLYPVAVAVSALTALATPWLIRKSSAAARFVDERLPAPVHTFAALYGSWLERLRRAPRPATAGWRVRRLFRLLLLDAALLGALIIGAALTAPQATAALAVWLGLAVQVARALVIGAAALLALPFCVGVFRSARRLGIVLGALALPEVPAEQVDLALAPRRALIVALQLACVLLVATPLVALTQPFLPSYPGAVVLVVLLVVLGVAFWRSAIDLQGHVRAGAQMIVQVLAAQSAQFAKQRGRGDERALDLDQVHPLLPGLGEPVALRLDAASPCVGRSLADLNLRGVTGALVIAITRAEGGVLIPTASEILRAGDVLTLAGTHEAIEAARGLLGPAPAGEPRVPGP